MGKTFDNPKVISCRSQLAHSFKQILEKAFTQIPQNEKIITSFFCKCISPNSKTTGRVYLTHNFILYLSNDKIPLRMSIPICTITKIERSRSPKTGLYPAVTIHLDHGEIRQLSHLYYRNDFFQFVNYLKKHTQYFVSLPKQKRKELDRPLHSSDLGAIPKSVPQSLVKESRTESEPVLDGRWKQFFEEEEKNYEDYEKVDVRTAQEAEKLADDIISIQLNTREKIIDQAVMLDHIKQ